MKSNIKEFIEGILEIGLSDGVNKTVHHGILQDYLDEELPEEAYDLTDQIDEFLKQSNLRHSVILGDTIRKILQNPDDTSLLKETKLFYFLESFYSKCTHYSTPEQTEELFNLAIEYSLESREVEDFLAGVYPDYIDVL